MRVRLAVAALENNVFINVQTNMAARTRYINMGILFLPIINYLHFILNQKQEVCQKGSTYSYAGKNADNRLNKLTLQDFFIQNE